MLVLLARGSLALLALGVLAGARAVIVADPIGRPVAEAALGHAVSKPLVVVTGTNPGPFEGYDDLTGETGEPHAPVDVPEDSPALLMSPSCGSWAGARPPRRTPCCGRWPRPSPAVPG